MYDSMKKGFLDELTEMRAQGSHKDERVIVSRQGPVLRLTDGREVLNFCANNYLGLASHPTVINAAHAALDQWGYGLSSVRFICGTQKVHKDAERRSRTSSGPTTRCSSAPASTPTWACSRPFWTSGTRSSPIA